MALRCPSYLCKEGASLLGLVVADGKVALLAETVRLDRDFVETARAGPRPPERRFRFSGACIESACGHWERDHCSLVEAVVHDPAVPRLAPPTDCPIREDCRWYVEHGDRSCQACRSIVRGIGT